MEAVEEAVSLFPFFALLVVLLLAAGFH